MKNFNQVMLSTFISSLFAINILVDLSDLWAFNDFFFIELKFILNFRLIVRSASSCLYKLSVCQNLRLFSCLCGTFMWLRVGYYCLSITFFIILSFNLHDIQRNTYSDSLYDLSYFCTNTGELIWPLIKCIYYLGEEDSWYEFVLSLHHFDQNHFFFFFDFTSVKRPKNKNCPYF